MSAETCEFCEDADADGSVLGMPICEGCAVEAWENGWLRGGPHPREVL